MTYIQAVLTCDGGGFTFCHLVLVTLSRADFGGAVELSPSILIIYDIWGDKGHPEKSLPQLAEGNYLIREKG